MDKIKIKIKIKILKFKLNIYSYLNKVKLPTTNKNMIDKKHVRHVYKIEKENFKAFYCMINGKSYLLSYEQKLEDWLGLSEIEIKPSEIIHNVKKIAKVSNLKDYPIKS